MKSDGKIENDLASIFFLGIYDIVSVYIISIPIIYNIKYEIIESVYEKG